MSTPPAPVPNDATHPITTMVQSVDELGTNTERLFGRLYGALRRKRHQQAVSALQLEFQVDQLKQLVNTQALNIGQLTGVLAAISEGVVMQDGEGRIVMMNQAARDLLGSMRNFWDSELGHMFAAARGQAPAHGEIKLGDPERVEVNHRVLGAQIALVADERGERLGTVLMLRDVTRDALSDRLKDQFVTQMSHELRTPLTAIKGMSEVLLASPAEKPPNRKFLEAISRNVAVLDRMIVELLDISEIGAGSFAVRQKPVHLPELIFDVIQGFQPRLDEAPLEVVVSVTNRERLTVVGDDRRLQWAIGHLIDNSIKYTEPGGKIMIAMGRVRAGHIHVEVSDTGVGISPQDMPHVFERFYRGEARTPTGRIIDPRGLGQGLFVAKAVSEAHGGYLSAASVQGDGTTVTLGLPLDPKNRRAAPHPPMPAAPDDEPPVDPSSATIPNSRTLDEQERNRRAASGDTSPTQPPQGR